MSLPHTSPTALIRARALSGFDSLVERLGGDPLALLKQAALTPEELENPENCIDLDKVVVLADGAAKALAVPDFGFRLAAQQDISVLGAVALIAQNSATVGEALAGVARHLPYHTPSAHLSLDADPLRPGLARIAYDLNLDEHWPRQQTIELSYGVLLSFLTLLTGEQNHDWHLSFRHAAGCTAEEYQQHFTGSIDFQQNADALSIPQDLLDTAISANNRQLRESAERFVQNLLRRFPLDVVRQVETLVERQLASGGGTLQRVAAQLGLHERTLQRRLNEQDCYFEDIVDRLRRERANTLLLDSALPLAEIASVLGYSEQSSLNRSCGRWFGVTPQRYRKQGRSPTN